MHVIDNKSSEEFLIIQAVFFAIFSLYNYADVFLLEFLFYCQLSVKFRLYVRQLLLFCYELSNFMEMNTELFIANIRKL